MAQINDRLLYIGTQEGLYSAVHKGGSYQTTLLGLAGAGVGCAAFDAARMSLGVAFCTTAFATETRSPSRSASYPGRTTVTCEPSPMSLPMGL